MPQNCDCYTCSKVDKKRKRKEKKATCYFYTMKLPKDKQFKDEGYITLLVLLYYFFTVVILFFHNKVQFRRSISDGPRTTFHSV